MSKDMRPRAEETDDSTRPDVHSDEGVLPDAVDEAAGNVTEIRAEPNDNGDGEQARLLACGQTTNGAAAGAAERLPRNHVAADLPKEEASPAEPGLSLGIFPPAYWKPRVVAAAAAARKGITPISGNTGAVAGEAQAVSLREKETLAGMTKAFNHLGALLGVFDPASGQLRERDIWQEDFESSLHAVQALAEGALPGSFSPEFIEGYRGAVAAFAESFDLGGKPVDLRLMPGLFVQRRVAQTSQILKGYATGLNAQARAVGPERDQAQAFSAGIAQFIADLEVRLAEQPSQGLGLGVSLPTVATLMQRLVDPGTASVSAEDAPAYSGRLLAAKTIGAALGIAVREVGITRDQAPDILGALRRVATHLQEEGYASVYRPFQVMLKQVETGKMTADQAAAFLYASMSQPGPGGGIPEGARKGQSWFHQELWQASQPWVQGAIVGFGDTCPELAALLQGSGTEASRLESLARELEQLPEGSLPASLLGALRQHGGELREILALERGEVAPAAAQSRPRSAAAWQERAERDLAEASPYGRQLIQELAGKRSDGLVRGLQYHLDQLEMHPEGLGEGGWSGVWAAVEHLLLKYTGVALHLEHFSKHHPNLPHDIEREAWAKAFLGRPGWQELLKAHHDQAQAEVALDTQWLVGVYQFWQKEAAQFTGEKAIAALIAEFVEKDRGYEAAGLTAEVAAQAIRGMVGTIMERWVQRSGQ